MELWFEPAALFRAGEIGSLAQDYPLPAFRRKVFEIVNYFLLIAEARREHIAIRVR